MGQPRDRRPSARGPAVPAQGPRIPPARPPIKPHQQDDRQHTQALKHKARGGDLTYGNFRGGEFGTRIQKRGQHAKGHHQQSAAQGIGWF